MFEYLVLLVAGGFLTVLTCVTLKLSDPLAAALFAYAEAKQRESELDFARGLCTAHRPLRSLKAGEAR